MTRIGLAPFDTSCDQSSRCGDSKQRKKVSDRCSRNDELSKTSTLVWRGRNSGQIFHINLGRPRRQHTACTEPCGEAGIRAIEMGRPHQHHAKHIYRKCQWTFGRRNFTRNGNAELITTNETAAQTTMKRAPKQQSRTNNDDSQNQCRPR